MAQIPFPDLKDEEAGNLIFFDSKGAHARPFIRFFYSSTRAPHSAQNRAAGSSLAPHSAQNAAFGGFGASGAGAAEVSGFLAPHSGQKRIATGFTAPQAHVHSVGSGLDSGLGSGFFAPHSGQNFVLSGFCMPQAHVQPPDLKSARLTSIRASILPQQSCA